MQQFTYALLLLASIAVPIARSFEKRVHFRQYWKSLFSGILIMMIVFIPWDIIFTIREVWGFNPRFLTGFYLFELPIEEWLFFIVIPYCVVFSFEVIRYFFPRFHFPRLTMVIAFVAGAALIVVGLLNADRLYTLVVMLLGGMLLVIQPLTGSHKTWLSHFFLTYVITLLGFFVVNGILTSLPVVWYDDAQNLGVRIFSIPFEDTAYFMAMMLIVMMVYQKINIGKMQPDNNS